MTHRSPGLISPLKATAKARLTPLMSPRRFDDGAFIHGPSQPSGLFFWIVRGVARFCNVTEDGESIALFSLRDDDFFGDIDIFSGLSPPHLAYADGPLEALVMPAGAFRRAVLDDPALAEWALREAAIRTHQLFALLDDLRRLAPQERIWRYLNWLCESGYARSLEDGWRAIDISQSELADRLRVSRATLSARLAALRKEGALRTRYRRIELRPGAQAD